MPLFFFHVYDGSDRPDGEGTELPDLEAARANAVKLAGDMLKDHAREFWNGQEWQLSVTDAQGLALFTLIFIGQMAPTTCPR